MISAVHSAQPLPSLSGGAMRKRRGHAARVGVMRVHDVLCRTYDGCLRCGILAETADPRDTDDQRTQHQRRAAKQHTAMSKT